MINWKIPILVSYAYVDRNLTGILNENKHYFDVILDSGAFTAFKTGRTITLDEYCDFLQCDTFDVEFYFTLDEIGNSEKTKENFYEMLRRNLTPIPIFTRGDPIQLFFDYYKIHRFIGIGGVAGTENNKNYMKDFLELKLGKTYNCHWLGFWDRDFLYKYKPPSCDTNGWQSTVMFGRSSLYVNRKFSSFTKENFKKNRKLNTFCEKYGIDYDLLYIDEVWQHKSKPNYTPVPQVVSALSFLLFVRDCLKHVGTKVYLACSGNNAYKKVELLLYCKDKFGKFLNI